MIPIGDEPSEGGTPWVNYGLIATNVLVFLLVQGAGASPALDRSVLDYSYVPADPRLTTAFASMFMHGSWMHLLGNMLYLWIFGDNVEARFGRVAYLALYLATGLLAGVAHGVSDASSAIPSLGASGAISGVQGLYLVAFPHNRVKLLVFFYYMARVIRVPALGIMLFWFVINDVFPTVLSRGGAASGGVAHMAHIGGFVSGVLLALLMRGSIKALAPADRAYGDPTVWGDSRGPQRWDSGRGVGAYVRVPDRRGVVDRGPDAFGGFDDASSLDHLPARERILTLWRAGRWSEAAAALAQELRAGEVPDLPDREFIRLCGRLYDEGRYDDAKAAFTAFLGAHPGSSGAPVAAFALGMIASRRDGDLATARRLLAIAAERHPDPASRELAARELARIA